jgi:DNA invertase Pin-like site-specific DNA recombinase
MNHDKITPQHKSRGAVVYVRQSTATQVLHHRESQERQYALQQHAQSLGFAAVEVIDEDLGRSGSGLVERPGFLRLLERVLRGEVGAVFALEASRLARNNRDWHHLVDLCATSGTLVIDHDGVYDARLLNDRLLLGLKGTMSEFELGLLRQRAQEALRQKIARGEVLHLPPAGYERTEDNRLELTADLQVQHALKDLFARFRSTGSARQTLLQLRQEGARPPSRDPQGRLVWRPARLGRIVDVLKNPIYAGAFVYGRTMRRTVIKDGRQHRTAGHARPREEWPVVLRDHHAGYLTWADYESNQRILLENAAMRGKLRHAVKGGTALLAGLLRCHECGRPLHVSYGGRESRSAAYRCQRPMSDHGRAVCCAIAAQPLDEAVAGAVLAALQPAGLEAALQAGRLAEEECIRSMETLRLAREQARYEAERRRRQFEAVEPENRLVAAELERRWNAALQEVVRLEEPPPPESGAAEAPLTAEESARLRTLGADVTAAWDHPAAPIELKKRILRTVLVEILVRADKPQNAPASVTLILHWAGGVHTTLPPIEKGRRAHPHTTAHDTVELIRRLAAGCPDEQIAAVLNRHGRRTGRGLAWKAHHVADVRRQHGIAPGERASGWLTLEKAAAALGTSPETLRRLIRLGTLPAEQVIAHAPWFIAPESLRLPQVVRALAKLKETGHCASPRAAVSSDNLELPLA